MSFRAPAYPLITVDPYFSIWSMTDRLYESDTQLWNGIPTRMIGVAEIDGVSYHFMGKAADERHMEQVSVTVETLSTTYVFEAAGVQLTVRFTTPVLPEDLHLLSRPVSYIEMTAHAADDKLHRTKVRLLAAEDFCVSKKLQNCVCAEAVPLGGDLCAMRMGGIEQNVLGCSGDDISIDWGYVYLALRGGSVSSKRIGDWMFLRAEAALQPDEPQLFLIAYDDVASIKYFNDHLPAYWKTEGAALPALIEEAAADYTDTLARCQAFHATLWREAQTSGGEHYARLLTLSFRQIMAAHKLVVDKNGELLYISKECLSNGCAATVDISYPSMPVFLLYNPALIEGMLRPVFRFAANERWPFPFAPHDVGTYPILNGQVYSNGTMPERQMPIEECGNMLLLTAALFSVLPDRAFVGEHKALLDQWADYLMDFGADPDGQLCTDDFMGHLARNCNLALKSIMALDAYGYVCDRMEDAGRGGRCHAAARSMAAFWRENAANEDGTYRLAFDRPGSFSMKYNAVWDRVFELGLFEPTMWRQETEGYRRHMNPYGLPLDDRSDYTKSDWMVWTATLTEDAAFFGKIVAAIERAYRLSPSRVPMTDLYSSVTSMQIHFQHRSVQGGLFMKLLYDKGICRGLMNTAEDKK